MKNHLPAHAQEISTEAFNSAWAEYAHEVERPHRGGLGSEGEAPQGRERERWKGQAEDAWSGHRNIIMASLSRAAADQRLVT